MHIHALFHRSRGSVIHYYEFYHPGTPPPKDPSPTGSCTSLTIVSIRGTPTLCPTQTRPSARDTNGMQIVLGSLWPLSNCISYKPWVLQLWIITTGCFCSCLPLNFCLVWPCHATSSSRHLQVPFQNECVEFVLSGTGYESHMWAKLT